MLGMYHDLVVSGAAALSLPLVSFAYERVLVPVYGSGPTSAHLAVTVMGAVCIAVSQPWRLLPASWLQYVRLMLFLAPNSTYYVAILSARRGNPVLGPLFTHLVVLAPLVFLHASLVIAVIVESRRKTLPGPVMIWRAAVAAVFYVVVALISRVWPTVPILNSVSENAIFLILACTASCAYFLQKSAASAVEDKSSTKKRKQTHKKTVSNKQVKFVGIALTVVGTTLCKSILSSPILPHPLREPYQHPTYPLRILSSVVSNTGLILVGEALPFPLDVKKENGMLEDIRYLRASHSLLGGVWTGKQIGIVDDVEPLRDSHGTPLGDSVYGTFVVQEAVRLINSTRQGAAGVWERGLIIGLGTGISATGFMRHNISTTIIEIDPAVYDAAREYFALPDPGPGHVFLEDARGWVARNRAAARSISGSPTFDFVVHDCFSGGGVPEHLYTVEFWDDMKALMQPEGIAVVNFAGIIDSHSTRMMYHTLTAMFGQCRAFHDQMRRIPPQDYTTEFINLVFFCTSSSEPLTFRKASKADFLGSPLRKYMLESLADREIDLSVLRATPEEDAKWVLKDGNNPLGELQRAQGAHHWKVMRQVLPDIHWEIF
ncbi:spermine/spermidine synthase [Fistulina hepatica ATCC 64428]|uniref:Spermine/spermidine synthase n=1 Tax=Fistulina hepatica ATCC 64428 TaxID=1128425 RepID=A0A0D7AMB9_9AGAR|nr:spermine/spermidine synthase [Fistulina hepatica ATCC 64428]